MDRRGEVPQLEVRPLLTRTGGVRDFDETPTGFRCRRGVPGDAPALASFAEAIFRETFGPGNRPDDLDAYIATAYGPGRQEAELRDPAIVTLLAEMEGALAGYVQLSARRQPEAATWPAPVEIMRFYVGRRWQGRGVARALMLEALMEAVRMGGRTVWLCVWEHNPRAIAFYAKCGFADVGSAPFQLGADRQTDRIMARSLAGDAHASTTLRGG